MWTGSERLSRGVEALERRFEQLQREREVRAVSFRPLLSEELIALWTRDATPRHCETLAEMVGCELCRRGLRFVRVGSRTYCRVEAHVVTEVVTRELDLDEIAGSIAEAKMEGCCG